jgi:hypothetical protein
MSGYITMRAQGIVLAKRYKIKAETLRVLNHPNFAQAILTPSAAP